MALGFASFYPKIARSAAGLTDAHAKASIAASHSVNLHITPEDRIAFVPSSLLAAC
jgi:hypothetical protein